MYCLWKSSGEIGIGMCLSSATDCVLYTHDIQVLRERLLKGEAPIWSRETIQSRHPNRNIDELRWNSLVSILKYLSDSSAEISPPEKSPRPNPKKRKIRFN